MKRWITVLAIAWMSAPLQVWPQAIKTGMTFSTRQTPVHDPVLIKQGHTYYLFGTGRGISVFSSKDLQTWKKEKPVFEQPPAWAAAAVPGYEGHAWAPDISYYKGLYYLLYSVSTFGKNNSCVGMAVNTTLDPTDPAFEWEDKGMIIRSVAGSDHWNAIDPNLVLHEKGKPWLCFGSFWNGIQLVALASDLKPAGGVKTIASRCTGQPGADSVTAGGAIEAPFVFRKNGYYYLFVSWDYCCKGRDSNYKVVVGRSRKITGPYVDKKGQPMAQNGGSLLIGGNGSEWMGIGHNAVFTDTDGTDYFVAHGYDEGESKLWIRKLRWATDGWPLLEGVSL
ncbi:family 43 glycosylhydrolase [Niabella sp. CC-SYL272]|uniref:family 43 glycosylhydrolase n=1 Tax=Niabella agricola TaxID=2891571 RepID=UPI001F3BAEFD|nr:family 43 glycosylhydrolase [Niabella agricola]MCF3107368.1 family 43 glycosylhydrolase [Niabella agricola]